MENRRSHWENIYTTKSPESVSWFQDSAKPSLEMIRQSGIGQTSAIIDIGGGASVLPGELLALGYTDVTVLDIAEPALAVGCSRLGPRANRVNWIVSDVLSFKPERQFDLWHDRAAFHFLAEPGERAVYRSILHAALRPGGSFIVAAFASDGPERCSGLPVHRWSADGLAEELGKAFVLQNATREAHRTPWGAVQAFLWCRFTRL